MELTKYAKKMGANGCLVVAPYYNKPTPAGLIDYYWRIADIGLPVIVYNIPGRTGVNITPETMVKLAEHHYIVAIKEATGSLDQMGRDILLCGEKVSYLSGDDALTLPLMSIGGSGVISVISNLLPRETAEMVHEARSGNWDTAQKIYMRMLPLCHAMFLETNPIPVKFAMAMMGWIKPVWRSPMTPPSSNIQKNY